MEKIAILDFGGQYAHLIANRIRRLGVYSSIVSPNSNKNELKEYKALIFSGGPHSIYDDNAPQFNEEIMQLDIPILGICYGHQLICNYFSSKIKPSANKEYGEAIFTPQEHPIFKDVTPSIMWMSHGDHVEELHKSLEVIGSTKDCPIAAIKHKTRPIFGLQFHPEVSHSIHGMKLLKNFLALSNCSFSWNLDDYFNELKDEIIQQVGEKKVFLLVSGGVDSNVCFSLLNKILGENKVYGLHIDNGFMRKNESLWVKDTLEKANFGNLHIVDKSDFFIDRLKEVYDPQEKRTIIGDSFIDVQIDESNRLQLNKDEWLLGQGTIYPDTIESGNSEHAAVIKTHHNRVDRIQELIQQNLVIEPICQLYKDEVRQLGELLKLPKSLVWRHPFPGPGLAVRILCSEHETYTPFHVLEQEINEILQAKNLVGKVLPIRSVGVQGDKRSYANCLAIKGDASWQELNQISTLITNKFTTINRVIYHIKGKFDFQNDFLLKKCYITKERIKLLQEADFIVNNTLKEENLYDDIWQMPIALIPVGHQKDNESIVLRPINSTEAMTAHFSHLDKTIVNDAAKEILEAELIDHVFYDITNKPPSTIEWE